MPTLIEIRDGHAVPSEDAFTTVADGDDMATGEVIVSLARFQTEGEALLAEGRKVGVRLSADQEVEALAYDLPRLSVVALEFPKFADGRAYSNARLLRERFGFKGQVRAVGDVLQEQAHHMLRCGFDAFEPADGASANAWEAAAARYRNVYQRAADRRTPAFVLREG